MDKISIVKRRKKELGSMLKPGPGEAEKGTVVPDKPDGNINETISINLTPEQYELVKSSQYIKYLLNGDSSGVSLDVQKQGDGEIVFNFQFKKMDMVRMLKSEHVCQMLQISRSTLMSLVRSKTLRSYKIGRLRRFLLQDIIDYLSQSEEVLKDSQV